MKKRIFLMCWAAYAIAYLGRVNFSVSMQSLMTAYGLDTLKLGIIAGAFFWAYAIGQLINGNIGDRVNPRYFVALGLCASGILNAVFGLVSDFRMLVVLWALNGFFQSMLWGPIVRTLSMHTKPERRTLAATLLSTSLVIGYFTAYICLGRLIDNYPSWIFLLPGIVLFAMGLLWLCVIRVDDSSTHIATEHGAHGSKSGGIKQFLSFLRSSNLFYFVIACIMHGVIKETIATWGPMLVSKTQSIEYSRVFMWLSFIPVVNFAGILFSGWLNHKMKNNFRVELIVLFGSTGVFTLILTLALSLSPLLSILLLGLISASQYALNSIVMSVLPLDFAARGSVSGVAGTLDFAAYLGAALSGPLVGALAVDGNWRTVLILVSIVSVLGIFSVYIARRIH